MREWILIALVVACGGRQKSEYASEGDQGFDCKDRLISYVVSGHMAASELGVQMDCSEGPRIKRWKVDKKGNRIEDGRPMSGSEFDNIWRQIDGSGWSNLKDCVNGTGGKQDPIYVFDVKDDQNTASFQCQSVTVPYPYNGLVDPLDAAAQEGRGQLGGDDFDEKK